MTTVALVPAHDREDSIAATVAALAALDAVDRVLVIDDGSTDGTTDAARAAGAEVLRLPVNRGKGGAVLAGAAAAPEADVFLLIDADLAATAGVADRLLEPVVADQADMTIAVLPPAAGRGGFGKIRDLAQRGIRRACGQVMRAPLSGQRAVRAELLRDLPSAERFGLEVALTIDSVNAGARVVEIELDMDHRHTGRTVAGFRHRAGQGLDIVRSLWPRIVSPRARAGLLAVAVLAVLLTTFVTSRTAELGSSPATSRADSVVVFGIPHFSLHDLRSGNTPNLDALIDRGALAAMNIRTLRAHPSSVEAYASLSAGTRVRAVGAATQAFARNDPVEASTAAQVGARRTGAQPDGKIVLVGAAIETRAAGAYVSSLPGALGDALAAHGLSTAAVGNSDTRDTTGKWYPSRPVAAAAMTSAGGVAYGSVDRSLLRRSPVAPFGVETNPVVFARQARVAMRRAAVTFLDPGEMDRAAAYGAVTAPAAGPNLRAAALQRTDAILGRIVAELPPRARLIVMGITPPGSRWELEPVITVGAGVVPGHLYSLSTRRADLVTLADVSTTILDAVGVRAPGGMIGEPFRYRPGPVDLSALRRTNALATDRERIYYPMALTFIVVQALAYIFAIVALTTGPPLGRGLAVAKGVVLTFAAWPLATFLLRIVPVLMMQGTLTHLLTWLLAAGIGLAAARTRGHPLAPLARITTATLMVLIVDLATGAHLQSASILGYSPHTSSRFNGIGNTAYAVLAACAIVTVVAYVDRHPRSRQTVAVAAAILLVVVVVDGAPWLGADVGGILSLVPIFTLLVYVLAGRRVSWKQVVVAALATGLILGVALGFDLLSPPDTRSHLGKFVVDSSGNGTTFWTTVSRKWSSNLRVFQKSIWTWMVPIMSVFAIYVLVVAKGWRRLLPSGSPMRYGVIAALGAGLLGWLVNDSGVVITALFLVYVGPYLTLLAIRGQAGEPELLPPTGPVPAAEPELVGA